MPLPIVAVVGRPNVGKSTLVNRLAQAHAAIVHETSGVTRDRSYHRAEWNGREFMLIDTGGIEFSTDDAFGDSIRSQAFRATSEADVIIFVCDGRTGPVADDTEVAAHLRKTLKPVLLVVNKLDDPEHEEVVHDFWTLGLGEPRPVSALHGHGSGDLLDVVVADLPEAEDEPEDDVVDVAIVGRPNAGKSSLFNKMVGDERTIVSEVAGTTRDAIDTMVERGGRNYRLVDTAGLRRRAQIDQPVEYYGFVRAMRAMDRADVALLIVDTDVGVTSQDQRIASFAAEKGCALAVLLNKWDLLDDPEKRERIEHELAMKLGFASYAPLLRISAKTGRSLVKVWDVVDVAFDAYCSEIPTSRLNNLLTEIRQTGHTVSKQGTQLKLKYVTQTRTRPPGFTFFANRPGLVDPTFRRYLENRFREAFDLVGTPIVLKFRREE